MRCLIIVEVCAHPFAPLFTVPQKSVHACGHIIIISHTKQTIQNISSIGNMSAGTASNSVFDKTFEPRTQRRKMSQKDSKRGSSAFDSADFLAFLSTENRPNTSVFKSKDSFTSLFQSKDCVSDLFKSKDSFSNMFESRDWTMSFAPNKKRSTSDASLVEDDVAQKTFPFTTQSLQDNADVVSAAAIPVIAESQHVVPDVMKSEDWVVHKTLGAHIEVPVSQVMFSRESTASEGEDRKLPAAKLPSVPTQWDEIFMNQLMPPADDNDDTQPNQQSIFPPDAQVQSETQIILSEVVNETRNSLRSSPPASSAAKKKRNRAPRKKVVPKEKVYVEPQTLDVLCGRGGKSNHHEGNKRYREEVDNLKEWYNNIDEKESKTDLSQCLVDYVESYGARFLEHDGRGWYIIDNIVARRKASQALREDTDPEKRRAKRQRFLAKRARQQEEGRRRKQSGG